MEAVIFVGVQGSGKSTYYRENFFDTHVRISLDLLRTRSRERAFLQLCLDSGQPFVIDNTNPRAADRAPYIEAARRTRFRIKGYFFESPLKDALRRNAQRAGKAAIPIPGVVGTFKRIERPGFAEGFHEIFIVTHGDDGRFVTTAWALP